MGQPVNPLLGNYQTMLGADPEMYRQQLVQAEQQRIGALPPQQALAAQLGTLLGRGVGNVATGQNFFEVTNPVLRKLTDIQDVYNQAMQAADPNDPTSLYKELQTRFADRGLGVQSLMAQQEGRRVEGEVLKTKSARAEYFKSNPDLINAEIDRLTQLGTPQALAEADSFKELKTRISRDQEFKLQSGLLDLAAKESTIEVNKAKIEELRREAKEGKINIVQTPATENAPAVITVFRNGKKEEEFVIGKTKGLNLNEPGGGAPAKPGERPPLSTFAPGGATPAPAPAAQPRKVGAVEQQELNRLEQRRRGQETAAQTIAAQRSQGRTEYDTLVAKAAESGLVPMGMSGSDIVFINPTTGQRILGSQL